MIVSHLHWGSFESSEDLATIEGVNVGDTAYVDTTSELHLCTETVVSDRSDEAPEQQKRREGLRRLGHGKSRGIWQPLVSGSGE